MLYLIGSVILTSSLTIWFKVLAKWKIPTYQAIVYNYITCVVTGSFVNGSFPVDKNTFNQGWFPWALGMGIMFIALFNVIGFNAQKFGVAITSVANKLSLVIPFCFSIYLYNEKATAIKIAGIAIALLAVILTCWPGRREDGIRTEKTGLMIFMIGILFLGSGFLDTIIKYVEATYLGDHNKNDYLITAFGSAALVGIVSLLILYVTNKQKPDPKAILAGIGIGIPNYFSIWCLIQVLKDYGDNSSAIIPINNMGIVLFSAVFAWLVFAERLTKINWLGIALSLIAIAMIAYG